MTDCGYIVQGKRDKDRQGVKERARDRERERESYCWWVHVFLGVFHSLCVTARKWYWVQSRVPVCETVSALLQVIDRWDVGQANDEGDCDFLDWQASLSKTLVYAHKHSHFYLCKPAAGPLCLSAASYQDLHTTANVFWSFEGTRYSALLCGFCRQALCMSCNIIHYQLPP